LASLTGIAFALVVAARTLITPTPPLAGGDESAVRSFFVQKQGVWLLAVWMTALVVIFGTWFFGSLRAHLARHGAGRLASVGFGGWLIVGALALARHALIAVPALVPLPLVATASILTVAAIMLGMVWSAAFITVLSTAIAGARAKALPWWFNFLSAVTAIVLAIGTLVMLLPDGYFSRIGNFRWIVLWVYVAWSALASLVLFVRISREAKDPAAEA
jgi:hypothetical protein